MVAYLNKWSLTQIKHKMESSIKKERSAKERLMYLNHLNNHLENGEEV